MAKKIYNYEWTLADAKFTKDKGKVFSCFACGGGSTMGYKLSGFDVLGCNELDPKMIAAYKKTITQNLHFANRYKHSNSVKICHRNCLNLIYWTVHHLAVVFQ